MKNTGIRTVCYLICSLTEWDFSGQRVAIVRSCGWRYSNDHYWSVSVHCYSRLLRSTSRLHWQVGLYVCIGILYVWLCYMIIPLETAAYLMLISRHVIVSTE